MRSVSILDFVRQGLDRSKGTWPEISRVTGISYSAITKIAQRQHESPRLQKLEKLAAYFRRAA
jgi:transcriptional regulator with XRE-family HTH domain